jgi:hypothetical protein
MKKYLIIIIFLLSLFVSCQKDDTIIMSYPPGSFTYQSYDSLGNLIVDGWLAIEMVDSFNVEGSWHLNNLRDRNDIGLQDGDGKLIGYIENSSISINLNPLYADHNVYLNGSINGDIIEGEWIWTTFIGPTNRGTFKAIKN